MAQQIGAAASSSVVTVKQILLLISMFLDSVSILILSAQIKFGLVYFGSPGKVMANLNCSLARVSRSECVDPGC